MSINIENISLSDFAKICRTCLSEGEMLPLYETCLNEICIIEMLMSCTFIQIKKEDGLPEQICYKCAKEINTAYAFAKQCENNEEILKNIANNVTNNLNKSKTPKSVQTKQFKSELTEDILETEPNINNVNACKIENKSEFANVEEVICETNENNKRIIENPIKIEVKEKKSDSESDYKSDDCNVNEDDDWSDDYYSTVETNSKVVERVRKKHVSYKKGPPYTCQPCNITFESSIELRDHRRKVQHSKSRKKVNCSVCQKEIASSQVKQHMRTHTKERPYVCKYCGRGFSLLRNMKRHVMIHTGERPYKCQHCDKAFIQYTSLKEHLNKHNGQTPYVCSICGNPFKYNGLLRKHMKAKHPDESGGQDLFEHECPTCHRRYHTKQILKQHIMIHGEKTYLCSVCGKGFYNNAGLQTHIKVHTGHRPHVCNFCGKAFRQTSGLKMHVLIHTGEKPYSCSICNKAFTQRNHLRYHMRTHTGEKPYTCTVCGKCFSTNGTLTVHKRTHTGETPYVCSVCGKGFYDSSSMKKHKRGHGEAEQVQETT